MSLMVLTLESNTGSNVLGIFLNEKLAKNAALTYVENADGLTFKRKLAKNGEETKRLLYLEDTKESTQKSLFMTTVAFDMPVSGKPKKVKDPNAPKKGMSAFMLFSNDQRNAIKTKNPEATFGEIGRKVGEAWRGLTDKQRSVYTKKAELDKKRYESDMSTYVASDVETTVAAVTAAASAGGNASVVA